MRSRRGVSEIIIVFGGTLLFMGLFAALAWQVKLGEEMSCWRLSRAAADGDLASIEAVLPGSSLKAISDALFEAVRNDRATATRRLLLQWPAKAKEDLAFLLIWAARRSSLEMFSLLEGEGIRFGASFPARLSWPLEEFRLFTAAESPVPMDRRLTMVRMLLERGAQPDARSLHWASARNFPELVRFLIEAGCYQDSRMRRRDYRDDDNPYQGMTPLRIAAACGSPEAAQELLLAKASPTALSEDGKTAFEGVSADADQESRPVCATSTEIGLARRQRVVTTLMRTALGKECLENGKGDNR